MDNKFSIKKQNFEKAKREIRSICNYSNYVKLDEVETEGGFLYLGDHKVTGTELNNLIYQIQNNFIDIKNKENKIFKGFCEVYNAFEYLQEGYIKSIDITLKSIEKTNDELRQTNYGLRQTNDELKQTIFFQEKSIEVLKKNEKDINMLLDTQDKIIKILKNFKEKIESQKHIYDIDKMWDEMVKINEETINLNSEIKKNQELVKKAKNLYDEVFYDKEQIEINKIQINVLNDTIRELENERKIEKDINSKKIRNIYLLMGIIIFLSILQFIFK